MTVFRFESPEKESLEYLQQFGMDYGRDLGTKVEPWQIGNRDKNKPKADGVLGDGSFAFFEQFMILAKKDAGKLDGDNSYSKNNIELLAKFMEKQGIPEDKISGVTTHLAALKTDSKDSLFNQAYTRLSENKANSWRLVAEALSPPIVAGAPSQKTAPSGTQGGGVAAAEKLAVQGTFTRNANGRGGIGTVGVEQSVVTPPVQRAAATTVAAPQGPVDRKAVRPAVYNPATDKPDLIRVKADTPSTGKPMRNVPMTVTEYESLQSEDILTVQQRAKVAAFKEGYDAALKARGLDTVQAKLTAAQEVTSNNSHPTFLALRARVDGESQKLTELHEKLRTEVQIPIKIGGKDFGTFTKAEFDSKYDLNFWSSDVRAARAEMERQFNQLKKTGGYNKQLAIVNELSTQSRDFGKNALREVRQLEQQVRNIYDDVRKGTIVVAVPAELFPQERPAVMAAATPARGAPPPTDRPRGSMG